LAKNNSQEVVDALLREFNRTPLPIEMILSRQATLVDKDATVDTHNRKLTAKPFDVRFQQGKKYRIAVDSDQFDACVSVRNSEGDEVAFDDDSGGNLNSLLAYTPIKDGTYTIYAAAWKGLGDFRLRVVEVSGRENSVERMMKRQANAAAVLLGLGRPETA